VNDRVVKYEQAQKRCQEMSMIHWKWSKMGTCQLSNLLWPLTWCRCLGKLRVESCQNSDDTGGVTLWKNQFVWNAWCSCQH